jgi:hypothetical protein
MLDPATLDPPKSMKLDETIAKWRKEEAPKVVEKEYRSRSLIPHKSQVLCLAAAYGDNEPECWTGKEHVIIKAFRDYLKSFNSYDEFFANLYWVGWNVRFDITNIRMAAYRCGEEFFKNNRRIPPLKRYDSRVVDLMEGFIRPMHSNTYKVSMDEACKYLGIQGKGDMDGSKVYDYYIKDLIQEICDYCVDDVKKCQQIFDRIF